MPALASKPNTALRARAETAREPPVTGHSAADGASGTGRNADIISAPPPPPPSPLRPLRRTTRDPNTSDPRLLLDLTGNDDDVFVSIRLTAPATPRKTPKRPAERDSDSDDVKIIGEASVVRNRINETPTKRARSAFLPQPVATANSINSPPPPGILGDAASLQGPCPLTPPRIARRPTQLGQRPSTPSSRNQRNQPAPSTPASRASSNFHAPGSVASQAFFSPVSSASFTPRRRDGGSPSPLSRGRHGDRESPISIQDSDSDRDYYEQGSSYDNPIDVDAAHERAVANWYRNAQEADARAEPEVVGDGGGAGRNGGADAADGHNRLIIGPANFIRRRPISLAEIWTLPLNERGEPSFPALGPDCWSCRRPTAFRRVSENNRNGNDLRPYYVCLPCDVFGTWADRKGISVENARCYCGEHSRQDRVGEDPRGEKILRPGTPFWTCWQKRCGFFAHG